MSLPYDMTMEDEKMVYTTREEEYACSKDGFNGDCPFDCEGGISCVKCNDPVGCILEPEEHLEEQAVYIIDDKDYKNAWICKDCNERRY